MDADEWQAHVLRAREILERSPVSVRRVLDFGAGVGHLVAALRSLGVDAVGIEPSLAGRERARRRYGVELLETLTEAGSSPAPDLVVLLHSLEHAPDPVAALRSLGARLAPGGAVFIEVPNAASFEMWFAERRRQILDLPVHLYHFTPASLSRIVQSAGLRVTEVRLTNPDWLERILARRPNGGRRVENGAGTGGEVRGSRTLRRTWRSRVVPWIRSRSPGWKFQLVAQGLE
jgi:SAM-dependent methyltransferase